jgi:hypothetical protein
MRIILLFVLALFAIHAPAAAQEQSPLAQARAAISEKAPVCRIGGSSAQYVEGACTTREAADALYARLRELRSSSWQVFDSNCMYDRAEEPRRVISCNVRIERR